MSKKFRLLTLVLALSMLLAVAPLASAQGTGVWDCSNLPADDCDTLTAALSSTYWLLNDGAYDMTADISISGGPALPGLDLSAWDASVSGTVDLALHREMAASNLFGAFDVAVNSEATSSYMEGQRLAGKLNVTYSGGNLYWSDLQGMGYAGITSEDVLGVGMMAMTDPTQLGMLAPVLGIGMVAMNAGMATNTAQLQSSLAAAGLPYPLLALQYERLDSMEMMGQNMHGFRFVSGRVRLSEETAAMLGSMMTVDPNADPMMQMAMGLIPAVLSGAESTIEVVFWVGEDDSQVHTITLNVDSEVGAETMGGQAMNVTIAAELHASAINGGTAVMAPEGATMVEPDALLNMLP